jgi:hypothetical protein
MCVGRSHGRDELTNARFGDLAVSEMAQELDRMVPTELSTANDHAGLRIKMY